MYLVHAHPVRRIGHAPSRPPAPSQGARRVHLTLWQRHISSNSTDACCVSLSRLCSGDQDAQLHATHITVACLRLQPLSPPPKASHMSFPSAAAHTSADDPVCSAAGCSKRGVLLCKQCVRVRYCSTQCQFKSWQLHKAVCTQRAPAVAVGLRSPPNSRARETENLSTSRRESPG